MTGLFVTLEGGDGVGKTTQAELLTDWLTSIGREVVRTREPGGTPLGVEIRRLLLDGDEPVAPHAEALLYAADRAHHIATVVAPALARGAVVVQDRYLDSSIAYQGAGRVLDTTTVRELSLWAAGGLLPDVTVLLDLDPEAGLGRVTGSRESADRLEREAVEFHRAVRAAFLDLADDEPERFLVIDAAQPPKRVADLVRARVAALLDGAPA